MGLVVPRFLPGGTTRVAESPRSSAPTRPLGPFSELSPRRAWRSSCARRRSVAAVRGGRTASRRRASCGAGTSGTPTAASSPSAWALEQRPCWWLSGCESARCHLAWHAKWAEQLNSCSAVQERGVRGVACLLTVMQVLKWGRMHVRDDISRCTSHVIITLLRPK